MPPSLRHGGIGPPTRGSVYPLGSSHNLAFAGVYRRPIRPIWLGHPLTPDKLGRMFGRFARDHGFPITYHGLRHSAAVLMLSSGIDVRTAASRLGHANVSLTLNVYGHHARSADEKAAQTLDAALMEA
jgi:integrase